MVSMYLAPSSGGGQSTTTHHAVIPEIVDENGAQITILDAAIDECGLDERESTMVVGCDILPPPGMITNQF